MTGVFISLILAYLSAVTAAWHYHRYKSTKSLGSLIAVAICVTSTILISVSITMVETWT